MSSLRISWLIPSLQTGNYWHPVFKEFTKIFKETIIYTGFWAGYSPGFEDTFVVKVVGRMKFLETKTTEGYTRGGILVSPKIISDLHHFKPQVIFASAFSLWTLLVVLLKPIYRWRIIIVYDGSTPNIDCRDSAIRTGLRRLVVRLSDAFITNTQTGKAYLTDFLNARPNRVFQQPYQVPDATAVLKRQPSSEESMSNSQRPVFLFTGQLIKRKGLHLLLESCTILKSWGYHNYTLQIIGQGVMREELEAFSRQHDLPVEWIGWVDYDQIGFYFRNADVFVLPTLEDTWGMVVLESMVLGKPVICSRWAGASEMILHGQNGYLVDPSQTEEIAVAMRECIDHPESLLEMGQKSKELIASHTPVSAAQFLAEVTDTVVGSV